MTSENFKVEIEPLEEIYFASDFNSLLITRKNHLVGQPSSSLAYESHKINKLFNSSHTIALFAYDSLAYRKKGYD